MTKPKELKWLYEEFPDLVEKGVLDSETVDRLKKHYGPLNDVPVTYNLAFIIIGILGAVLIGGGIILIFAYNWEDLSRTWRTIFSFLPLVIAQLIYGYTYFKKRNSTAWVEASSGFLMLMLASCIALISQTYNLGGSLESFLFTWMLLSIPLLYLMNASLPAIFYMIGIASWATHASGSESVIYWAFLLAVIPHLYFNIKPNQLSNRAHLLGWTLVLTLGVGYLNAIEINLIQYSLFGTATLVSSIYFIGQFIYQKGTTIFHRPFQTAAIIVIFIMSMILTFSYPEVSFNEDNWGLFRRYDTWAGMINIAVLAVSFIGMFWLGFLQWKKEQNVNWFVMIFPLLIFLCNFLVHGNQKEIAGVLMNIYLFTFGLYYIKEGIELEKIGVVNLGMFFVSAIIVARFFDTDWSFMVKGIVFVVLGICFLMINYRLSRRFKE